MKYCLIIIFFWALVCFNQARADVLAVDLANEKVDITTGFTGVHLKLFGVKEKSGDIAIVIRGPEHDMLVRKKHQIFGVWANLSGVRFENVPSYYDYALSAPDKNQDVLVASGIGMDALNFETKEKVNPKKREEFLKALIRNKQTERRFSKKATDVVFITDHFFKANFYIPSNVPTGEYTIDTYLIQNGNITEIKTTQLHVGQIGFGAQVLKFANTHSMIYGLLCVLFALSMGWLSTLIAQRT